MNLQPAQRAVTTMASPVLVPKDEPFLTKLLFAVFALVIGLACFTALMAIISAVMPRTAERCRSAVERRPWLAFGLGLVMYAIGAPLAVYLLSRGYITRLLGVEIVYGPLVGGLGVILVLLLTTFVGASGTVRVLGERLVPQRDGTVPPIRQIVVGTLVAVLGAWFPLVGWLIVTPALMLVSSGATIVGWFRGRQAGPPAR